jgi:ATP-binding cassette, subfamily B, bacterial
VPKWYDKTFKLSKTSGAKLTVKLKKLYTQLRYIPDSLRLIWVASREWTLIWLILLVLQGCLPLVTIYLIKSIVDHITTFLSPENGEPNIQHIIWLVISMVAVMIFSEALGSLTNWIRTGQSERVQNYISSLIHSKAITLDLAFYDMPNYYDRLHRARIDALNRPVALLENVGNLLQNGITFIAMVFVLLVFGWWVPLVLIFGVLPALIVVMHSTLLEHQLMQRTTTNRRSANYYDWLITDRDAAAEMRIFGLGYYFQHLYQTIRQKLYHEHISLARRQFFSELLAGVLALTVTGITMGWMVWKTGQGLVTLGNLVLFYQTFTQGQRLMRTLLGNVRHVYSNILFIENLFEFLALVPQVKDPVIPIPAPSVLREGISFQNITFRYPGNKRLALINFNLVVPAGQVVAIVGENGAGKSTIIKLLCRLYDPEDGKVMIDNIDIRDFAQDDLRQNITVLFQQPVHYHATVKENILWGDLKSTFTTEDVHKATDTAGATKIIDRLPHGFETLLGNWFGGTDLSGGEWQRIALVRAFLRRSQIIALDEPTSAMDSWAEADWMQRFRYMVAGRTGIVITHRLTTAAQADVIHVIADGRIVESGTYNELLAKNGRFAYSWQRQMQELGQSVTLQEKS